MSAREPRPFADVRTGRTVESMVRDLPLALSTRELEHWVCAVAPRVGDLEALIASRQPIDPLAAERDSAAATLLVDVAAAEAAKVERLEAEVVERDREIEDLEAQVERVREASAIALREQQRSGLALEAQVVDLLALEQVIITAYRRAGVLPADGPPPSTAEVLALVRGPQPDIEKEPSWQ